MSRSRYGEEPTRGKDVLVEDHVTGDDDAVGEKIKESLPLDQRSTLGKNNLWIGAQVCGERWRRGGVRIAGTTKDVKMLVEGSGAEGRRTEWDGEPPWRGDD